MRLHIVTPARPLVDADVTSVVAPGSEGEFGVLPEHANYLLPLDAGVVRWQEHGEAREVAISGGFAEVSGEHVTILATEAEYADDVDPETAEERRAEAAAALEALDAVAPLEDRDSLAAALKHAEARLSIAPTH